MKVRIPKGTKIWGTFSEGTKVAGRTYEVKLAHTNPGYEGICYCHRDEDGTDKWVDHPGEGAEPHPYARANGHGKHCVSQRPASVCWVGAGSYWHHAALSDVEILEES